MSTPVPDQSFTFLRIKRKRNEEPLDALVVESSVRRKKTKGRTGLFQFAQTIEPSVWEDEAQKKAIQDQLSRLVQQPATTETDVLSQTLPPASPPKPHHQASDPNRRYTIVEHPRNPKLPQPRRPTSPPQIISAKELAAQRADADFTMYDAVPEDPQSEETMDPALEKLLQDYLKFDNPTTATTSSTSSDDDYVWDLFYHKPGSYNEAMQAMMVGTVSGLPPLGGDSDSDYDSEVEDEADEDSNAEEYYKNDYPEDEESDWTEDDDGDEFHEDSEGDEIYADDGDDHDWR